MSEPCEYCNSKNTEHLVWEDEEDPHREDICVQCLDCDHITTLRTEIN